MLRKALYPKVEAIINPIAKSLGEKGFTPNQLTLGGMGLTFIAGFIFANGLFFLAGIVLLLASLGDLLDGPLARTTNQASPFGAFLDSTVDRYSDFFIFGGIAVYFAKLGDIAGLLLVMGIILGSFVTSYSKARAENIIKHCNVGIFERAERIITLAIGSIITPLFPFVLWILFLGTNATAIHRILHTRKALLHQSPAS